jgi:2'-5' RNA ligase
MEAPSYHLWLKPSGKAYDILADAIRELSQTLQAPLFDPHVTLLSRLTGSEPEHLLRTEQLAAKLRPFQIILTEPSFRDDYFQCLFMKVKETPQIMDAHATAKAVFAHKTENFMPHLSLMYGRYPIELKQKTIATLPADLCVAFESTAVSLIRANSDAPQDWYEMARIPMGRDD